MSSTKGKTLADYQKLIKAGYTLSNWELVHFNKLWGRALQAAVNKAKGLDLGDPGKPDNF